MSILGYVQRGGTPRRSTGCSRRGSANAGADLVAAGTFGVMVASEGESTRAVPLELVAGQLKTVPPDHPLDRDGAPRWDVPGGLSRAVRGKRAPVDRRACQRARSGVNWIASRSTARRPTLKGPLGVPGRVCTLRLERE